jgi:hypothetical protein
MIEVTYHHTNTYEKLTNIGTNCTLNHLQTQLTWKWCQSINIESLWDMFHNAYMVGLKIEARLKFETISKNQKFWSLNSKTQASLKVKLCNMWNVTTTQNWCKCKVKISVKCEENL